MYEPWRRNLNSNNLTGPIPDAWSENYGFNNVAEVYLSNNRLTGPAVPDAWAHTETAWYNLMIWCVATQKCSVRQAREFSGCWEARQPSKLLVAACMLRGGCMGG